jgi:hypothetical protein
MLAAKQGQKQNTTSTTFPAPTKGIIATEPMYSAGDIGLDAAIWLYNMVAGEYGCRVRQGSIQAANGLLDLNDEAGDVRTVFLYNSVQAGATDDIFFATTSKGIWDITDPDNVSLYFEWPVKNEATTGWCSVLNYTNVNGDHFILLCDEDNGYYIFDGVDWALGTFTGSPKPNAEDLVQITEWNSRIWFVERNSARAWYLDPLALKGDVTPFDVGNRFKKGGHLVQNTTWTLDDGAGMDDKFVQISSSGDILVWEGVNVGSNLTLVGRWTTGETPEGRRVMSDWGGDVHILTQTGVVRLSILMEGNASLSPAAFTTNNISRYIRERMQKTVEDYGWSMETNPREGIALISTPASVLQSLKPLQFVYNVNTGSWGMFRDLDVRCMDQNVNGFFFGTSDGRVMLMDGYRDNVTAEDGGDNITFSLLTHFSHLGSPASWKRPQFVRPAWIGSTQPTYNLQIRYDFDIGEVLTSPPYVIDSQAQWDVDNWDEAIWEGRAQTTFETIGVRGQGRHIAVAIRGTAYTELSYLGADLMFEVGGML